MLIAVLLLQDCNPLTKRLESFGKRTPVFAIKYFGVSWELVNQEDLSGSLVGGLDSSAAFYDAANLECYARNRG